MVSVPGTPNPPAASQQQLHPPSKPNGNAPPSNVRGLIDKSARSKVCRTGPSHAHTLMCARAATRSSNCSNRSGVVTTDQVVKLVGQFKTMLEGVMDDKEIFDLVSVAATKLGIAVEAGDIDRLQQVVIDLTNDDDDDDDDDYDGDERSRVKKRAAPVTKEGSAVERPAKKSRQGRGVPADEAVADWARGFLAGVVRPEFVVVEPVLANDAVVKMDLSDLGMLDKFISITSRTQAGADLVRNISRSCGFVEFASEFFKSCDSSNSDRKLVDLARSAAGPFEVNAGEITKVMDKMQGPDTRKRGRDAYGKFLKWCRRQVHLMCLIRPASPQGLMLNMTSTSLRTKSSQEIIRSEACMRVVKARAEEINMILRAPAYR